MIFFKINSVLTCSKDDGARLIRKMIIDGILVEETHRQDNQYASLVAKLKVNPQLAARVESGALKLTLAFAAKPIADTRKAKKAPEKERKVADHVGLDAF